MNNKTLVGVVLVLLGGLFALKIIGITLAPLMSLVFPFILIGLGAVGLKNNKPIIGTGMIVVGVLMVMAKLHGLMLLIAAIVLIVWGVSMFKGNKRVY
ncbi:hypothetical protein ACFOQM_02600 [Paenibacillus sp. GCM10012307]|uniref:LiaF transmembrane domain-containing protein n=1 Tax=Paenibacillus roseus TaxID=2798579 RepID=A0A934MMR1_9BACL|nr:hypothetical protein [Paenibacillus roseus]MBJ6360206.1 hypothetical protein [Paenibacillus roseus]